MRSDGTVRDDELALLQRLPGALVAVGDDGTIEFASDDALRMVGWDSSLRGRPLTTIIPARLQPHHRAGFHRYVATGQSRLQGKTVRVPALRRDGSEREIDLTIRVFRREDGSKFVAAALSEAATGRPPRGLVMLEDSLMARLYQLV